MVPMYGLVLLSFLQVTQNALSPYGAPQKRGRDIVFSERQGSLFRYIAHSRGLDEIVEPLSGSRWPAAHWVPRLCPRSQVLCFVDFKGRHDTAAEATCRLKLRTYIANLFTTDP
jgi:hypothetical protein